MAQKRKRSPEPANSTIEDTSIFRSEPIEDRQSTFIGYYSPGLSGKELQRSQEFKEASHKILAWRKPSKQRSLSGFLYDVGHNDDGEKYGGKRVEKVLEQMQVSGACVVARWYGGVLLGPVRFTHIETCAREAVRSWQSREAEEEAKRRKVVEDAESHDRLAKTLVERDRSIDVLRAMAAEKEKKVKDALVDGMEALQGKSESATEVKGSSGEAAPSSQTKKPAVDYMSIPLDRLKALDKARDATLSFLLKRIEKAEADFAALGETENPPRVESNSNAEVEVRNHT